MTNPLRNLYDYGQSFWYDSLSRDLIANGELKRMVEEDGLRGVTSNPTIFHEVVSQSDLYDDTIAREGRVFGSAGEIFDVIAREDIRAACDLLRPVYNDSQGADGFISLEESPHLAHNTAGSIKEGHRLRDLIDRPNLFVKVPATPEGVPAVRQLLTEGVNVNITLMFSLDNYDAVADAYLSALEDRHRHGLRLDNIASVASMFVSRIDTKVDGWIDKMAEQQESAERKEALKALRGKIATANAKQCYLRYKKHFQSDRFRELERHGARPQRVLFASTSTKDPAYPDTYYVDALIGPNTVVTMAPATVPAFRDHGNVGFTLEKDVDQAGYAFRKAADLGIDLDRAMQELQNEGVARFAQSFDGLLEAIEEKRQTLSATVSR